jgi:paired amphipathic helix protein Sin3a
MNSQNLHGRSGGAPYDREREMDDRHRAMQQQHDELRRDQERERERDRERDREREQADRYQQGPAGPGGAPHQSSAGSIPIHQPVASRITGAIHSPGGLLANHSGNAPPPGSSLGGPSGPVSFGGPLQQGGAASQPHQMYAPIGHSQAPSNAALPASTSGGPGFGGPHQQQQQSGQQDARGAAAKGAAAIVGVTPGGHQIPGGITQGQQPILNVST